MQVAVISTIKCSGHKRCPARKACPARAVIQLDPGECAVVNPSLCRGCGGCVTACPAGAIEIRQA